MTGEFSWDEVYARRRVLAEDIRRLLGLSFSLGRASLRRLVRCH